MCDYAERYLRTNMRLTLIQAALTTTAAVIAPPNPLRHCIMLPNSGANAISLQFGDVVSGVPINGWTGNPPQVILSRDHIGDIITYPIRMLSTPGAANVRFEEYSYDPVHFATYMRCLNEWLAQYGP